MTDQVRERIKQRAFEIYEWRQEHDEPGSALSDWLEAELEVLEDIEREPPLYKVV